MTAAGKELVYRGNVWKFGNDVDTDAIIPARYLTTSDATILASHCMEDADATFAATVKPGDVIVAGKNFGCGSSREHAPISIKAAGVSCVIARSFARIFFRNAINIGLPIFECPAASEAVEQGHVVSVLPASGTIRDESTGCEYAASPFPEFMQALIGAGGLVAYTRTRLGVAPNA